MKAKISERALDILADEELSEKVVEVLRKGKPTASIMHEGRMITVTRIRPMPGRNSSRRNGAGGGMR